MDWGDGHLTIIVGMGSRAFANKSFSNARGGGFLAAQIDSHITVDIGFFGVC